jgi:hypothetical protein
LPQLVHGYLFQRYMDGLCSSMKKRSNVSQRVEFKLYPSPLDLFVALVGARRVMIRL